MIGKYTVLVQNRAVRYKFDIERNISIIRGNSATGKTTLINMIADFQAQGKASGVDLVCDKKCVAMVGIGEAWRPFLDNTSDCMVFIDEGEKYVSSKEFAEYIRKTNNYYIIATRNNLYDIPYSVDAIYEIKSSGKYGKLKKTYNSIKKMYSDSIKQEYKIAQHVSVVVEDAKSGYQFWKNVCEGYALECVTAKGKGNILKFAESDESKKKLIVADGAAFGPEMANVYGVVRKRNYDLFLPESFEWLILKSGIISEGNVKKVLDNPSEYIDSREYFSWEQFFTAYLIEVSKNKEYKYSKNKINSYYLSKKNMKRILGDYFDDI